VKTIREDDAKLGRHFPVVALTADVQMAQRQVYMSHGFDECLLKPVSLGQFRRLLIRWGLLKEGKDVIEAPTKTIQAETSAIDRNAMVMQMGAFDENAVEMLKLFVDMTQPLIKRLRAAQANNDLSDLKEAAHSLKGAARSACLNDLGEAAAQLQTEAENKGNCGLIVEKVIAEFERARGEIAAL
jgi:two-component system, sensor histidine kinase and response regulator